MRLIEHPPAPPRRPGTHQPWHPPAQRHPALRLAGLLSQAGWRWKVELAAVAIVVTVWGWLATFTSRPAATIITASLAAAVVMPARVRAPLGWIEHRARLRRRWDRACRHAGLETFNERVPRVIRIGRVPVGEVLRVRLPAGQPITDVEARAETLAAYLQVREVQVARDPDNARYAEVRLVRRDALAGTVQLAWPNLNAGRLSLWEPIPVGVDEHARTISISLVERNLLLGGEPGAGKSVAQSMLIATAALGPEVDLWLLDGKRVELAVWRDCARAFVGPNIGEDDPCLGRPLCMECWDYAGAVLWNAHASELWRRTRIRIYRELVALSGISERQLKRQVLVSYVKVAEYQRRGLVHFHLLVRLDAARPPAVQRLGVPWRLPHRITPPPGRYTVELLAQAVRNAVAHVTAPYPEHILGAGQGPKAFPQGKCAAPLTRAQPERLDPRDRGTRSLTQPKPSAPPTDRDVRAVRRLPDVSLVPRVRCARWGKQIDVREVAGEERAKVAGYLAKYATKHTECVGGLDRRVKVEDLDVLPVPEHVHRLVVVAWLLALHDPNLRTDRWAHQLGYGGHFLTKSRHYSTTFTKLRTARVRWAAWQRVIGRFDPWESMRQTARQTLIGRWEVAGFGWRLSGDALLAQTVRNQAQTARQAAREARHELTEVLALAG